MRPTAFLLLFPLAFPAKVLSAQTPHAKRAAEAKIVSALKGSPEERTLIRRYTEQLNTQEDQLATLTKELATLKQQRQATNEDLEAKIQALNLDEAV